MSAYILSVKAFDTLYAAFHFRKNTRRTVTLANELANLDVGKVVMAWRRANVSAVKGRYPQDAVRPDVYSLKYSFDLEEASDIELFSIISCLTYQCYEGNIPKTKAYRQMVQFENALTRAIAMAHPEYTWGLKPATDP